MIPEQVRLWAQYGQIPVGIGDAVWAVADWDSRRWITAEGPSDVFGDDEGEETCRALLPIIDDLEPTITKVTLSAAGEVRSTSTSPEDDCTPIVDYPLFTEKEVGEDSFDCVQRSRLEEIDRLYICVDLVNLKPPNNASTLMAFKYTILQGQLERLWKEAFLVKRLQSCRYVVPFHNFIFDDAQLALYPPFRKDWLQQLMDFVDDLNLSYGIVHQDIAPRNLFVEPLTNNLVVIDFGLATHIGSEHEHQQRNDVDGVIYTLYEILTHDEHFRDGVQPDDYRIEDVTSMEEWPLQVDLEPGLDVPTLRSMVMKWVEIRHQSSSQRDFIYIALTIPKMPSMGMGEMAIEDEDRLEVEPYDICRNVSTYERSVRWERTPQRKLRNQKKE
ncbi:hypothetical protein LTR41_002027 [Exophiala xenobiotica]|nr:hypothetical protein LTR41_002027 [Exophiala xenobiotica]